MEASDCWQLWFNLISFSTLYYKSLTFSLCLLAADTEPEDQEIESYYTQHHDHDFNGKNSCHQGLYQKFKYYALTFNPEFTWISFKLALYYLICPIAKYWYILNHGTFWYSESINLLIQSLNSFQCTALHDTLYIHSTIESVFLVEI